LAVLGPAAVFAQEPSRSPEEVQQHWTRLRRAGDLAVSVSNRINHSCANSGRESL